MRALVSGASRGIGLAVARALARKKFSLVLVARGDRLAEARDLCSQDGSPQVDLIAADLGDRGALKEVLAAAAGCDALVNNAGIAPSSTLERSDDQLWDAVMQLNVHTPFALCRAALPEMVKRGHGRIVNVASTAALRGFPYVAAYCASKHALLGLTRALSCELDQRAHGVDVTVNAVCPGFVDTDIVRASAERLAATAKIDVAEARERLGKMNPGGRLLNPEEVADAVLALILEKPGMRRGAAVELGS